MKFSDKRHARTMHVSVDKHYSDEPITLQLASCGSHAERLWLEMSIKDVKEFVKLLQEAIEKAEKLEKNKEVEEDE